MSSATIRSDGLRRMLTDRRRELEDDVRSRVRNGRDDQSHDRRDELERSDANIQEGIEFALLQMRTETLGRIGAALARLDAGEYGSCAACDGEIAERRLRALPFAVRCQACEERLEQTQGRARQLAQRRGSFSLFPAMASS